ncbi:MAG: hypothetical protein VX527_00545 [Planctomycetota bacterium]|nr:hypothetical protein [Planctomycetota bacterium]
MRGLLLIAFFVLLGCQSATHTKATDSDVSMAELPRVLAGMQERSDLLQQLHGWGVVELRWTDAEGSHFEQGDLEFWMEGSDRLAVRISKLGDPYFWIGTDGTDAWIFDLSERPRRLMVDSMAKVRAVGQTGGPWLSILDTVRMMRTGLGASPPPSLEDVSSLESADNSTWRLTFRDGADQARRVRLHVDSDTWRPLQLELFNTNGTKGITVGSRSSRTKRVEIPNRSSLGSPIVSAIMDVRDDTATDTLARFAFEGLTTDLSAEPVERLFDLDTLRASLRPEVEGPLLESRPVDDLSTTR